MVVVASIVSEGPFTTTGLIILAYVAGGMLLPARAPTWHLFFAAALLCLVAMIAAMPGRHTGWVCFYWAAATAFCVMAAVVGRSAARSAKWPVE
jgi:hypothetical protein